jgi:hypothetical protein
VCAAARELLQLSNLITEFRAEQDMVCVAKSSRFCAVVQIQASVMVLLSQLYFVAFNCVKTVMEEIKSVTNK